MVTIRLIIVYVDPGAGSMFLQALIAAIAAGLVAIKIYWRKVQGFLFRRNRKINSADERSGEEETR